METRKMNENGMGSTYSTKTDNLSIIQKEFMDRIENSIRVDSKEKKMYYSNYSKKGNRKPFKALGFGEFH